MSKGEKKKLVNINDNESEFFSKVHNSSQYFKLGDSVYDHYMKLMVNMVVIEYS